MKFILKEEQPKADALLVRLKQQRAKDKAEFEAVESWDLIRDGITQSMIATFLTCKEKMNLSYIQRKRKIKNNTEAMDFGNVIHDVLAMIYNASKSLDRKIFEEHIEEIIEEATNEWYDITYEGIGYNSYDIKKLERHHGLVKVLLPEYFQFYADDFDELNFREVEEVFDIDLEVVIERQVFTFRLRGKIDGVLEYFTDSTDNESSIDLELMEHKTKGKWDEEILQHKLPLDLQVNLYLWAVWRKYGIYPGAILYNMIRKPQLRQGKKETLKEYIRRVRADIHDRPEFYFKRIRGEVNPKDIMDWEKNTLIPILADINVWWGSGTHYKNVTACTSGYLPCPFIAYCGSNNNALYDNKRRLFSELKVEAVPKIAEKWGKNRV